MIDFYKELHLNPELELKDIQSRLRDLEESWKDRFTSDSEKAEEMLEMIKQAKEAFSSPEARNDYERELEQSQKPEAVSDPLAEKRKEYEDLIEQARSYCDDDEYELAELAIERAKSHEQFNEKDDNFWHLSSEVYLHGREYTLALSAVNRAIFINGNNASHYLTRARIWEALYQNSDDEGDDEGWLEKSRKGYDQAIDIAQMSDDEETETDAEDRLAYSLYFFEPTSPEDREYAITLAKELNVNGGEELCSNEILEDLKEQEDALENEYYEYRDKGECSSALDRIDQLISLNSDNIYYYLERGIVYEKFADSEKDPQKAAEWDRKAREEYKFALDKAVKADDAGAKATAQGCLGFSLYFRDPKNKVFGEILACEANAGGKDLWGNSTDVIEAIKKEKEEQIRQQKEEEKKKREAEEERIKQAEEFERSELTKEAAQRIKALAGAAREERSAREKEVFAVPGRIAMIFYIISLALLGVYTVLFFVGASEGRADFLEISSFRTPTLLIAVTRGFLGLYFLITAFVFAMAVLVGYLKESFFEPADLIDCFPESLSLFSVLIGVVLSVAYAIIFRLSILKFFGDLLSGLLCTALAIIAGILIGMAIGKIVRKIYERKM